MLKKIDKIQELLNVPNVDASTETAIANMKILNLLVDLRAQAEQLILSGVGSCPDLTSVWNEAVTKQDKGEHNLFVTNDCWGALRLLEKHGLCKISKL